MTPMKVLLATDGSDDAKTAVAWMPCLPLAPDREVMVITVVEPQLVVGVPDMIVEVRSALFAEARRLADDTAAELLSGRSATGRVVEGDARDEIVATAAAWGADLVVLGARGLGAVKEFLLGSVSLEVARHAASAVLVCKGTPREVRTVTVAMDGSEDARRALTWLVNLPQASRLHVRLVGVVEPQRYPSTAPGILRTSLRTAVAAMNAQRHTEAVTELNEAVALAGRRVKTIETVVLSGGAAEKIVQDAVEHGSDLVVVGARGRGAVKRLLLGSVSESVLRHASCPVLVVPPASRTMS